MSSGTIILFAVFLISEALSWEALPNIPTGRRSQFLVLREDGAYKFGYDTGSGHAGKQEADPSNQVQGHYFYKNAAGQDFDLKYTSGVQGFVPENLDKIQDFIKSSAPSGSSSPLNSYIPAQQSYSASNDDDSGNYKTDNTGDYQPDNSGDYKPNVEDDKPNSGDATYNFNIDTPSYKRTEASDAGGNIQGSYSFSNKAGTHDLQYEAGAEKGFIARSGSLSKPNGLGDSGPKGPDSYQSPQTYDHSGQAKQNTGKLSNEPLHPDGSYSFGFSTNDQSREESGDVSGNVKGKYSYKNKAGNHDLSYRAGANTGFVVTGGSLALPNGLPNDANSRSHSSPSISDSGHYTEPSLKSSPISADGSYSFGFSTNDQSRQEDGDSSGNVHGKYSYKNSAGNHDLSFVAGSATGFLPTGGSLAVPNGLGGSSSPIGRTSPDVSGTSSESERYQNAPSDDQANTGDASYNFNFDTPEYSRQEVSDSKGNIKGSFSYRNKEGHNDLSFVAGSATGFLPTGGSLSIPNGLTSKSSPLTSPHTSGSSLPSSDTVEILAARSGDYSSTNNEQSSGDASYKFSFDTDDYKRQESSDASGNIKGAFSYKNNVGTHDLSFVSGSATGFLPTGGSLSVAPGLSESQLNSGFKGGPAVSGFVSGRSNFDTSSVNSPLSSGGAPESKSSYSLGNVKVHAYFPPSNEKHKFGYIFDTQ